MATQLFFVSNSSGNRRSVLANDIADAKNIALSANFAKEEANLTVEQKDIATTFHERQSELLTEHANNGDRGLLACYITGDSAKWIITLPEGM